MFDISLCMPDCEQNFTKRVLIFTEFYNMVWLVRFSGWPLQNWGFASLVINGSSWFVTATLC